MANKKLDNLVTIGKLKPEPPAQVELDGLIASGTARLADAKNEELSFESRFDLAYNAAHSLALAALRFHGYRSEARYLVFQTLEHTLELPSALWRILDQAHGARNRSEYEGYLDKDQQLLAALLRTADEVEKRVRALLGAK
ncbi:MAG TPA: hypothetical protein VFV99_33220 [Kofleriaceae bacterium]|nr:hypothetical protein [Kofleriaceae bacterium]